MTTQVARIGIVGCGHFGRFHAEAFQRLRNARVTAFCNRTPKRAEAMAREFGATLVTTNPDELFASDAVDGVVITTHHDSHADLCRRAVAAGKHVLVEKPLGMSLKECDELVAAVAGREGRIAVGYKYRYFPSVQRARTLLPRPDLIVGQFVEDVWTPSMWQHDPRTGGGSVLGNGCHTLDMLCYLAQSRPTRVYAEGAARVHPGHPCLDQLHAIVTFENGASGVCIQSQTATPARASKYEFTMTGADGTAIELYNRLQSATFRIKDRTEQIDRAGDEAIHYQARAFVAQICDGAAPACGLQDGFLANLMLEACFRSQRMQMPVRISWDGRYPELLS
jgi:predicted dehydrogenase